MGIDKRFASEAWSTNPFASWLANSYQANANALSEVVSKFNGGAKQKAKLEFSMEQLLAASSPSNFFAFNPDAMQKAIESNGESIKAGIQNMLTDLQKGTISMTDESAFEVGKNVATTEGAVVFENDFFQLIEYKPLTEKVFERPFLLIPPCINKFYILDLQPENSFVRYAVSRGHRTFLLSWRNPDSSMANVTWDDYIEHAAIKAITTVQDICQASKINTLGFCVGGTILATSLAMLKARGMEPVASATFLTTLLDFSDTGVLDVFVDEEAVSKREKDLAQGGLLKGQELAMTFAFLRPNDLVWSYVVGNYLKGETPPAFDLLYWNGDATNLPGPMYTWYLRNTYLENNLMKPKRCKVAGTPVDLGAIDVPCYIYGSREDHIVPIGAAYASTQILKGEKRFVMGASGHIAGVINPPIKNKRSHWLIESKTKAKAKSESAKGAKQKSVSNVFPKSFEDWLSQATEKPGSWWSDWSQWLAGYAGKTIASPKAYGRAKYRALEDAPGRYVKVKA